MHLVPFPSSKEARVAWVVRRRVAKCYLLRSGRPCTFDSSQDPGFEGLNTQGKFFCRQSQP